MPLTILLQQISLQRITNIIFCSIFLEGTSFLIKKIIPYEPSSVPSYVINTVTKYMTSGIVCTSVVQEFNPESGIQKAIAIAMGTIFLPMIARLMITPIMTTLFVKITGSKEDTTSSSTISEITLEGTQSIIFGLKHTTKSYVADYISDVNFFTPFTPSEDFAIDCIASGIAYTGFTMMQNNGNMTSIGIALNAARSCIKTIVYKTFTIEYGISVYFISSIVAIVNAFMEDYISQFFSTKNYLDISINDINPYLIDNMSCNDFNNFILYYQSSLL